MKITLDLPEKYSDIISLTAIATDFPSPFTAQVNVITRAIGIRGRDGQTRIIRADGSDEWQQKRRCRWEDRYGNGDWHCSNCGAIVEKDEQLNHNWYFCYHCGEGMEVAQDAQIQSMA